MRGRALVQMVVLSAVAAIGSATVCIPLAGACKLATPRNHEIDPAAQAVDQIPPSIPTVSSVKIQRGPEAFEPSGGCGGASSCDDAGVIELMLSASDDRAAANELGYRLELQSGLLPQGLTLPTRDVRPINPGSLVLPWSDGEGADQEAFSATVRISAIDRAGNVGPPTTVTIAHPGSSGGCAIGGRGAPKGDALTVLATILIVLLAAARRPNC